MEFTWYGINRKGEGIHGVHNAQDRAMAIKELQNQGILVRKIANKSKFFSFHLKPKKISSFDITSFTRQLATMVEAGVPLIQAFENIIQGQNKQKHLMKVLLGDIKINVSTGKTLKASLEIHPKHFNTLFCNLIGAGEHSGTLDKMLANLASYREKMETMRKKIKTALYYPIVILVIAILVSTILLVFVIPEFQSLFDELGAELPRATKLVIRLSKFVQEDWHYIGLFFIGFLYYACRFKQDSFIIQKSPIFGQLLKKAGIAHFSRTLAVTFAAGIPLLEAIPIAGNASNHPCYTHASHLIREGILKGKELHIAMVETKVFPSLSTQMIAIGEASGTLEKMLAKVADIYEEEVDNTLEACSRLLEPILMTVLGILVGGLIISMYLPIFKLGSIL